MLTPFSVPALSGTPRSGDPRISPDARQCDPTPMRVSPTLVRITGGHGSSGAAAHGQRPTSVLVCGGGMSTAPIGLSRIRRNKPHTVSHEVVVRDGVVHAFLHHCGMESRIAAGHSGSLRERVHGVGTSAAPGAIATDIRETPMRGDRRVADFPARGLGYLIARKAVYNPVPINRIHGKGEPYHCNNTAPPRRLPGTVSDHGRFVIYSGKEILMGNKVHRLEPTRVKNGRVTELILWMAMRDDVMDPKEREAYELSLQVDDEIGEELGMDNLIANLQKMRRPVASASLNYTNSLAEVVDLQLVDLAAERRDREAANKIVELFPQHRNEEA